MQIDWIINNTTYSLDDREDFYFISHEGLLMPPLHRLRDRGVFQDGETDRGYRLDPRQIILTMAIHGSDLTDYYTKRAKLARLFKPLDNIKGELRFSQGSWTRSIDCNCIEIMEGVRSHLVQKFVLSLEAPDPLLYDPIMQEVYFTLSGGVDTFEVPMEVPLKVGTASLDASKTITYPGDYETFPVVYIYGPITDCLITNETSGDILDFDGVTIAADDYYKIDCRYSYKTVEDEAGDDKIADLTDDSDLATFSIQADPDAVNGINSFTVTGTGANEDTNIKIEYYKRYTGV